MDINGYTNTSLEGGFLLDRWHKSMLRMDEMTIENGAVSSTESSAARRESLWRGGLLALGASSR